MIKETLPTRCVHSITSLTLVATQSPAVASIKTLSSVTIARYRMIN